MLISILIDGQSRTSDDAADRPLNVRYDQKLAKYHRLADQNGFHFVPAVFSYTSQIHESIKRLNGVCRQNISS